MLLYIVFFALLTVSNAEETEDCKTDTRTSYCGGIFENKTHCFDEDEKYSLNLKDCLVTCEACDSYSCSNPQPDTEFNCTAIKDQCDSPIWSKFMRERCPQTCGRCDLRNGKLCDDMSGTEVCSNMKMFCNSVDYYDHMTKQCASTCNRCPNDSNASSTFGMCADQAKDCPQNAAKCMDANYSELMTRACAKTCNKCNTGCIDADTRCASWARKGFCTNAEYTMTYKKKFCAKTCNICLSHP